MYKHDRTVENKICIYCFDEMQINRREKYNARIKAATTDNILFNKTLFLALACDGYYRWLGAVNKNN